MFFRPKFGLVLGGGGARGGAHVGVLRVLSEIGYKPDLVIGTSVGGAVSVMLGAGWSTEQLERYFSQTDFSRMLSLDRTGHSLIGNERLRAELERLFGNADIRDLSPKVALMAADIRNGQRVLIEQGPIVEAVLASMAVPGLFPPIPWGEYLLVDGGTTDNVPTQAAYQSGAQRVVAVDLGANPETGFEVDEGHGFSKYIQRTLHWLLGLGGRQTAFDTLLQSQMISSEVMVNYHLALFPPDVLIRPNMPGIGLFSMEKISVAIRAGERAARQSLPQLRALVRSPLPPRKSRALPSFVTVPPIA
ncbi:MAG: patatin-like phospholipase family protein [Anaerolineae bacterium]|nr:patatin-like phospholipase family protein [Anaerolineae bacterium]